MMGKWHWMTYDKERVTIERKAYPIKRVVFKVSFDMDRRFIALLPALNLNFHSRTLEFEWLCFAIYIDKTEE